LGVQWDGHFFARLIIYFFQERDFSRKLKLFPAVEYGKINDANVFSVADMTMKLQTTMGLRRNAREI
jgi:hypothetical protein